MPKILSSIRARMTLAAVVTAAGVIVLAAFIAQSGRAGNEALDSVYRDGVRTVVQLQKVDTSLRELRFRVAGVLLDTLPVQGSLNHLRETRKELDTTWGQLGTELGDAEPGEQQGLAVALKAAYPRLQTVFDKIEKAYTAKENARLTEVLETDWAELHKQFIKPLQALIPLRELQAKATYERALAHNAHLTWTASSLALALTLLMGGGVYALGRSITRSVGRAVDAVHAVASGDLSHSIDATGDDEISRLLRQVQEMQQSLRNVVASVRQGVDSVASASGEIAQGNQDLSLRTEQQAGQLQVTASSMEQLAATLGHNADSARQASTLAGSASEAAERGGAVVDQVVSKMVSITASSRKIADITGVIDGIAFQTNILALNAAVEAARAGEQGRGFAVVASEVRGLAQRSAAAAREIKTLIGVSVEGIEDGSRLAQDAGQAMGEIVSRVRRVNDLITEISDATRGQSDGIDAVTGAVLQLDTSTQQNAALVEQAAASAASLRLQAERLTQAVAVFRLSAAEAG